MYIPFFCVKIFINAFKERNILLYTVKMIERNYIWAFLSIILHSLFPYGFISNYFAFFIAIY